MMGDGVVARGRESSLFWHSHEPLRRVYEELGKVYAQRRG